MSEWSTCGMCGRVVYINHLDKNGSCIYCTPLANDVPYDIEEETLTVEVEPEPKLPGHTAPSGVKEIKQ